MQIEATGKSVEIAIQNGLLECGLKRDEVEIEVINPGGLFKTAKVILRYNEKQEEQVNSDKDEAEADKLNDIEVVNKSETIEDDANRLKEEQTIEKPKKLCDTSRLEARGKDFLLGLARLVDSDAKVESTVGDNMISYSIVGTKLGQLIGFHGENLQALQILLMGLKTHGEGAIRVYIDVDGYKASRNQSIADMANRVAEQAIKIERNIHLDPMNAYERRIVHTTLQDRLDVTTESTGEGEKRHVVIKPIFKK